MEVILGMYLLMGLAIMLATWAATAAKDMTVKRLIASTMLWPAVLWATWKMRKANDK